MSTPVIDHIGYAVTDIDRSRAFYVAALGTLGIKVLSDFPTPSGRVIGFGKDKPEFWINPGKTDMSPTHVAFLANSRAEVNAFYAAAIGAGGRDNGAPGIRAHYHPAYYGAYVFDPDGNNIEAVCHAPE